MNTRFPTTALLLAVTILAPGCSRDSEPASSDTPPSIFLISIDTLRADRLPAWGYSHVQTPAIDRLARDGILFQNTYSQVPLTLPSHASILTGRLPFENGVRSNIGYRLDIEPGSSLPGILAKRGYATGAAVSAYVLRAETGLAALFTHYDDSLEVYESATLGALQRDGQQTLSSALEWLDRVKERPVFLLLHLFEPHTPYEPVEPFRSRYPDAYDGEIATVDAIVGRFLDELDRRGLYDSSAVVLISDHGEGLGDHGEKEHGVLLYRESIHVPMILKLPGGRLSGRRVDSPAQLVDLMPTLAAISGASAPDDIPGISLVDLAEGRAAGNRAIYSETLYPRLHLGWSELRSLTDSRHQYIESPSPELFDIVDDPGEVRNVREERRREGHALSTALTALPLNLRTPGKADPEEMARLSALGYLSGSASDSGGPRLNPRDHIEVLGRVQQTFLLNQEGRYLESAELCREILRDYPDLVDVRTQLAGDLRRLGLLDEALDAYHETVRSSPQLIDSMAIEIAKLELDRGNLQGALLNAEQAMKLNPDEAHLVLAGVALEKGDLATAEREARGALGPEDRPRVPALILLTRVLVQQGLLPDALAVINRAEERITRDGAPPVRTLASTKGDVLARLGRNDEAEAAFREEIARFPQTKEAYLRLAVLLASQHRFHEIEPTIEAMVTASPTPLAYQLASRAMADLGNREGATEYRLRGERLAKELARRDSR